jgi:hypothetical protein
VAASEVSEDCDLTQFLFGLFHNAEAVLRLVCFGAIGTHGLYCEDFGLKWRNGFRYSSRIFMVLFSRSSFGIAPQTRTRPVPSITN